MSNQAEFPNNPNGDALRRLQAGGDRLTEPRLVDFCFIFHERQQALAFADIVDDQNKEVCISYYPQREMWEAKIQHMMIPTYEGITNLETDLTVKAESVGGSADGWGCMLITSE